MSDFDDKCARCGHERWRHVLVNTGTETRIECLPRFVHGDYEADCPCREFIEPKAAA